MEYAIDSRADGPRFRTKDFTQRVGPLAGEHRDDGADEVAYVLEGNGRVSIGGEEHDLRPGFALFVARGTAWSAEGDARGVSVLVHEPEASSGHAVLDLRANEHGTATAGREFVLGATPECGCVSVTQFVGLIPPGRAPLHSHTYDEVVYVIDGEGVLHLGDEDAPLLPGTCVHLPPLQEHCLENTGPTPMRVLGVFHPSGSPASKAYEANE